MPTFQNRPSSRLSPDARRPHPMFLTPEEAAKTPQPSAKVHGKYKLIILISIFDTVIQRPHSYAWFPCCSLLLCTRQIVAWQGRLDRDHWEEGGSVRWGVSDRGTEDTHKTSKRDDIAGHLIFWGKSRYEEQPSMVFFRDRCFSSPLPLGQQRVSGSSVCNPVLFFFLTHNDSVKKF